MIKINELNDRKKNNDKNKDNENIILLQEEI
jgi:hypothetical protein